MTISAVPPPAAVTSNPARRFSRAEEFSATTSSKLIPELVVIVLSRSRRPRPVSTYRAADACQQSFNQCFSRCSKGVRPEASVGDQTVCPRLRAYRDCKNRSGAALGARLALLHEAVL